MMIYIDASFYLSLLIPSDSNHQKALKNAREVVDAQYFTTQTVLGEVITVGSQRFDKDLTIKFIEAILNGPTIIILENRSLIDSAWKIFKKVKSKNISWVDCFSQAVILNKKIKEVLTFNKDFLKLSKIKI